MKFRIRPFAYAFAGAALAVLPASAQTDQRHWIVGGANPIRYEISVTPNIDAATFEGHARIEIEAPANTASVTMNALDLDIERATIGGQAVRVSFDEERQTVTLTPRRALAAGRHEIVVDYDGRIYDDAYGLFRVSYEQDGRQVRALATQFQPGDARRLAPMWDQPDRRAVFSISVTAPSELMVVSNMPAAETAAAGRGLTRTRFADTPSMSSYLLFIGAGDFERFTADVDGVELGVVVRRGAGPRAQEALRAGVESLRYFERYFGIEYPLPKLDMVAVPGSGGFAAMENWGAILYFDQYLLLDADASSESDRQYVFNVVAHEIAHQWFGNLVTMRWWNDLWLNEGFASWMAAKAMEELHPDWAPWMGQLIDGTATAMALDARDGTHAIIQNVNTIDDANLAFDTITYEKGLAVIRMIEAYVGEDAFRQGVRDYLNAHLYANTETEDLWRAVQAASGQPVLDIARSFTTQEGFPLLIADGSSCRANAPAITLTQRRFAMDDSARTASLWEIPVVAQRVGGDAVRAVLPAQGEGAINAGPGCGAFVVNAGQSGFFRTLYSERDFTRIAAAMQQIEATDQLGLLLDYWSFGRSGDAPFTAYLDLVERLPEAPHPIIMSDTAASMAALAGYASDRPSEAAVKAYGQRTLRPYLTQLGWETRANEGSNDGVARAALIATLGGMGDGSVVAEARRRVASGALPAAIRDAVLAVYAQNMSAGEYDAMLAQARAETDFVEQRRLWSNLASARDEALAQRTLALIEGEAIPRLLRTTVLRGVAETHPRLAWDYLVANRTMIEAMLDPLTRLSFPPEIAETSSDPAIADALGVYARDFPEGAQATVAAAQSSIRLRAQTVRERMPAVEAWVARHGGGGEAAPR
ncbi:MAG: M1 family metallopeptidase [Hyphomonadaceae bacterium]